MNVTKLVQTSLNPHIYRSQKIIQNSCRDKLKRQYHIAGVIMGVKNETIISLVNYYFLTNQRFCNRDVRN